MELSREANALIRVKAKQIVRKFDDCVDVTAGVEDALEELYTTAFLAGFSRGADAVHDGTLDKAVRSIKKDMRA